MLESWSPVIIIHAIIATMALVLGTFNAFRMVRGDPVHKMVGRIWAVIMILIGISGLKIVARLSWTDFGFIDYFLAFLSIFTIVTISIGVWAAHTHRITLHKTCMLGNYVGLIGATIGVISVPGRRVPSYFRAEPLMMACIAVAIIIGSGLLIAVITRIHPKRPTDAMAQN